MGKIKQRLRVNDRYIKYNVASAFEFVLDHTKPRFSRAIKFYELQTAILIGKTLYGFQQRKKEHPDNWIRVSRGALSAARMVCKVRLLEHVIADKYPDVSGNALLKELVQDKEATELLRRVITSKTSKQLAYSFSWRELDRLLVNTRKGQSRYAPPYDISMHFAFHGGDDWKCSWKRAEKILEWTREGPEYGLIRKHYKNLQSKTTAYKYKPKGHHFGAFVWLDQFGGGYLRPTRPVARSFAAKLLAKIDNTIALRDYLSHYTYVRSILERQEYDLLELRLTASISPKEVSFKPLPHDLTILI